ncbi:MAG: thioredoxin family protein [Nocardioidaceae bacterium]
MSETDAGVIREVDDETFDEIGEVEAPVLVEFFATWCGHCRRFAPTLQKLAVEYADLVRFVAVNVDENPQLARRYGVSSTPTLVLLAAGQQLGTLIGAQPASAVRDLLASPLLGRSDAAPAGWVPVDACELPTAEQPLRVAEFDALFVAAVRGVERREPSWLRLRLAAEVGVQDEAQELIEREQECCSFFDFQLSATGADLQLDVRVPQGRVEVLDGLARQAEGALARAGAA